PLPDEVAERDLWPGAVAVERVRPAEVREEDAGNEPHEQDRPARIFVRAQHLNEDGEHGDLQPVDRGGKDEPGEIGAETELVGAADQLVNEAGQHSGDVDEKEDEEDREDLWNRD